MQGNIKRILVMDDEGMVREVVGEMLKLLGYEVDFAAEGEEAIEKYKVALKKGQPFDVVILDLTVSCGLDGQQTIFKLLEVDPNVKAVVSSGYARDNIMIDHKKYGFKAALPKPFRIEELKKTLAELEQSD